MSDVLHTTQAGESVTGSTPDSDRQVCTNILQVTRWCWNPKPFPTNSMPCIQPNDKTTCIHNSSGKEKGMLFTQSLLNTNLLMPTLCLALFHVLGNSSEHSPWPQGAYILAGRHKQMYRLPDINSCCEEKTEPGRRCCLGRTSASLFSVLRGSLSDQVTLLGDLKEGNRLYWWLMEEVTGLRKQQMQRPWGGNAAASSGIYRMG